MLIDGRRVNACLTLAAMHDGAEITTIEGLVRGHELHPLQTAFIEHDGFQCGYCTAGQIMSGIGCIAEGHAASAAEIRFWMSGNICRCGAYSGIVAAITEISEKLYMVPFTSKNPRPNMQPSPPRRQAAVTSPAARHSST